MHYLIDERPPNTVREPGRGGGGTGGANNKELWRSGEPHVVSIQGAPSCLPVPSFINR